jgi:hypothetical protein
LSIKTEAGREISKLTGFVEISELGDFAENS